MNNRSDWSESKEDKLESTQRILESGKWQHMLPSSKNVNWYSLEWAACIFEGPLKIKG
jgi:hypothetical protein